MGIFDWLFGGKKTTPPEKKETIVKETVETIKKPVAKKPSVKTVKKEILKNNDLPKWFKGELNEKGSTPTNSTTGKSYELNNIEG